MRSSIRRVAVCLAAVSALAATTAVAQKKPSRPAGAKATKYGALAVDRKQGFVYGWAYDQPSRAEAEEFATNECAKRNGNCSVVVEFAGEGCASFHTIGAEDGSAYGWGTASTQAAAESRSQQECDAFADGKASCSNHVWACNSKDVAPFKVLREDAVKPKAAKTDCLVQFEVELDTNEGDDWVNRYRSPLYRLAKADCPTAAKTEFHGYHYNVFDGKATEDESNPERKDAAGQAKGHAWSKAFFEWFSGRQPLQPGTHFRPASDVTVSDASDENISSMTTNVGQSDNERVHGVCLAYAPPGVEPIATYGADRCQQWVR